MSGATSPRPPDRLSADLFATDLRLAAHLRCLMSLCPGLLHDIKSPFNAIVLSLEVLRQIAPPRGQARTSEIGRNTISVIEKELRRLRDMVEGLIEQTSPVESDSESFDFRELVAEVSALVAPQARYQQVGIERRAPSSPLYVRSPRKLVQQAILIVAVDALRAMPDGGRLELSLEADESELCLEITDTGSGIPRTMRKRIFDRQPSGNGNRTGAGLWVTRSTLEANGGSIELAEASDQRTTFALRLPLVSVAPSEEKKTSAPCVDRR